MDMTHEEYERAASHWDVRDGCLRKMDNDALRTAAEGYIGANNTCALATGSGDFVRCTPVEYGYHGGCFWIFSEGGEKFRGLEHNKNVSLAIFDNYDGFGNLKGMQVTGIAEVVEPFSPEYLSVAKAKGIAEDALRKLLEPMNLIKIVPTRIQFLNSDFKKQGVASRQTLVYSES